MQAKSADIAGGGYIAESSETTKKDANGRGRGKDGTSNDNHNVYLYFFHVFFYMLYIIVTFEILWKLTHYILEKPSEIIVMPPEDVPGIIRGYIAGFDPYSKTLYAVLLSTCILVFYLVLTFIYTTRKEKGISIGADFRTLLVILAGYILLIILHLFKETDLVFIMSCIFFSLIYIFLLITYIMKRRISSIDKEKYRRWAYIFVLISFFVLIYLLFSESSKFPWQFSVNFFKFFLETLLLILIVFILVSYAISEYFEEEKSPISIIKQKLVEHVVGHPWNMGIFLLSLSLYAILCLFFAELKESEGVCPFGVLTLLVVALLISGGFFVCGHLARKTVEKSKMILDLLGTDIDTKSEENLIGNLRAYLRSLLLHFLVAISSYIFLKALFEIILPEKPFESSSAETTSNAVGPDAFLFIILLIPLYIFFFRTGLAITKSIYQRVYMKIETKLLIPHDERRKESFVKILVSLTKIVIIAVIVVDIFYRMKRVDLLSSVFLQSPFDDIIKLAIGIPVAIWILVLVLDPFFEKETIEVGSHRGEIKSIGFFFTRMETMTGEQIYIPNAELMAKRIKRLDIRKKDKKEKEDEERGIMIYFSCTLNYDYKPDYIEGKFKELFKEEKKETLEKHFARIGCEIQEEELDYIFKEDKSCPFVFLEDFKDYGIVYRFNFRVKNALFAPILKGYFMREFKENMDLTGDDIYTPVKYEITDFMTDTHKRIRDNSEEM